MPGPESLDGGHASPTPSPSDASVDTRPGPHPAGSRLRRAILIELRRSGAATPDQLAATLGVGRTTLLAQLHTLESANLVNHRTVRHGVGRPRHEYDITPDAQDLFPSNYDGLAAGLLAAVESVGGEELLDDVLAARRHEMGKRIRSRFGERLGPEAELGERVRELAVVQDELGYLSLGGTEADGTIRLHEHNCAIYRVASVSPAACAAELALFQEVLGVPVARERHIMSGDRCCTYRIGGPAD